MRAHEDEIADAGARVAVIGLGDAVYAKNFADETGIAFPLLIDEKRTAYRVADLGSANLLHLFHPLNARARRRARSGGHRQHALGRNPFQLGGSFVFGPGNRDLFQHVSSTFGDNAPVERLLEIVRGIDEAGRIPSESAR